MNSENLLKQLMKIESVSGNEKEIGCFLFSLLKKYFDVKKIPVTKDTFNIIATLGKPKIYLTAHMDTVPIGNTKFKEDKNNIYGRGSCDAKGCVSAMVCAAINAKNKGLSNFGLFFDVCEETDFSGIKKGLPEKDPPFVIVGEPSALRPVIGQKGLLGMKIIARGKAAHGARPEEGVSAIKKIVKAVQVFGQLEFPTDKTLGKTAVNIGIIKGGNSINTVPDYAEITVEIRTVKENKVYEKMIKGKLADFEIEELTSYDPILIKDKKLIDLVERMTNKKSGIKKGFTELYFWPRGIILGPEGNVGHTNNEFIAKDQLKKATKLYEKFIDVFTKGKI